MILSIMPYICAILVNELYLILIDGTKQSPDHVS